MTSLKSENEFTSNPTAFSPIHFGKEKASNLQNLRESVNRSPKENDMSVDMKAEIGHRDYITKLQITKRKIGTQQVYTRNRLKSLTTGPTKKFTMPKYN